MEQLINYVISKAAFKRRYIKWLGLDAVRQLAGLAVLQAEKDGDNVFRHFHRFCRMEMAAEEGRHYQPRRFHKPRERVPAGPCARHPDRHGVRIFHGMRYCHACGVVLSRRKHALHTA